jgi:hypothetical protein
MNLSYTISTNVVSSLMSITEQNALLHFSDTFSTLNNLQTYLFDSSGVSHALPVTALMFPGNSLNPLNPLNIINDMSDIFPTTEENILLNPFLSTLHGSLYETNDSTTNDESNDTLMEEPEGSDLPNNRSHPFENSQTLQNPNEITDDNVIDLTNESDGDDSGDNNNVISIVDDRREINAVHNIQISHMNHVVEHIPDDRNALRSIRKKIRETVNKHSEELLSFMIKPLEDQDPIVQLRRITNNLSYANFNPSASWIKHETNDFLDEDRLNSSITYQLGTSFETLSNELKNLHSAYNSTVQTMFNLSDNIENKLNVVETILGSLKTLPNISESNPASLVLYSSIHTYVKYEMESNNIENDYKEFMHQYGLFHNYRSLLQLGSSSYVGITESQKPPGSVCNICMNDNISYALNPCGHTYCTNCAQKTRSNCFICRTSIQHKLKIYVH